MRGYSCLLVTYERHECESCIRIDIQCFVDMFFDDQNTKAHRDDDDAFWFQLLDKLKLTWTASYEAYGKRPVETGPYTPPVNHHSNTQGEPR